ncbi:MAG: hypothetical protein ACP5JS_04270 [Fervidobacterium sp.]
MRWVNRINIKRGMFLTFAMILLLTIFSCVPQRPEPSSNDIYSWKMEILNSAGNVLIKSIEGTLIYVDSSGNGIIHDDKTGIYVYKGGFYNSDLGKKVVISNSVGTTYKDTTQIDFSKGGSKSLSTSATTISPTLLNVTLDKSLKTRSLWDNKYVTAYGYILGGTTSDGNYVFSYVKSNNEKASINISSLTSSLTVPLSYTTEATVTGFVQFTNGQWKLNVTQIELGKQIVGEGLLVDEVIDGLTFRALDKTYKLTGINVELNESSKTDLQSFISENGNLVQVILGKTDENGVVHVFLFSADGYKFYQEELLKDGKAVPEIDHAISEPVTLYNKMKEAYRSAFNKKTGIYSTFSTTETVESSDTAQSSVGKYVFAVGTVSDVTNVPDGSVEIFVGDWLKVKISAGNLNYIFDTKDFSFLKNKIVTFFGYLEKPTGSDTYIINLRAEWEYFSFAGGTGTNEDPFLIESPLHLISVRALATQNKHFKLNADIDLSGQNWIPIGTYSTDLSKSAFQGVFDGNGHKISNLTYNDTNGTNVGLFGYLYNATVTNLILENANISAKQRAGVLSGAAKNVFINKVKVINSNVYVSYSGSGYAGGLIGDVSEGSVIKACVVRNSTIIGEKYAVGGLLGQLISTSSSAPVIIENNYVEGGEVRSNYTSTTSSAGFICNYKVSDGAGFVRYNYAAIKVTNGQGFVGYIVTSGYDKGATNNYFDKDVATTSSDKVGTPAKSTQEMKIQSTFTSWDFTNTWTIDEGNDYPRLRWEQN